VKIPDAISSAASDLNPWACVHLNKNADKVLRAVSLKLHEEIIILKATVINLKNVSEWSLLDLRKRTFYEGISKSKINLSSF
jgi:chorismate-pyruvate lyase